MTFKVSGCFGLTMLACPCRKQTCIFVNVGRRLSGHSNLRTTLIKIYQLMSKFNFLFLLEITVTTMRAPCVCEPEPRYRSLSAGHSSSINKKQVEISAVRENDDAMGTACRHDSRRQHVRR